MSVAVVAAAGVDVDAADDAVEADEPDVDDAVVEEPAPLAPFDAQPTTVSRPAPPMSCRRRRRPRVVTWG